MTDEEGDIKEIRSTKAEFNEEDKLFRSESILLKILLEERSWLENVLEKFMQWEFNVYSAVDDAEALLNILDDSDEISSYLIFQLANHVATMESIMKAEFTHRYDSRVILKQQESFAVFHWCFRAITLCDVNPTLKEVKTLEDAKCHDVKFASLPFWRSLVDGIKWLKQAVEILVPCNNKKIDLSNVDEALRQSKCMGGGGESLLVFVTAA